MKKSTRAVYNAYASKVAELNQVDNVVEKFAVEPSVQQKLVGNLQLSSDFLGKVNIVLVSEQIGEKIGLGVGSPIASRTDTNTKDRKPTDPTGLTGTKYHCQQVNSDTAIKYAKLDAWAKFPDFQLRIRNAILKRKALDLIMIGFNGIKCAADTDITTYPKLQDVGIGWLQHMREESPTSVVSEGEGGGSVKVGAGGDYKNLDALVYNAVTNLIDEVHQEDTELVVICGRKLLDDKYFPLINEQNASTEKLATDLIISQKRIGGLPAVRVPFMPEGAVLITRLDNLSIYIQEGSQRRSIVDNAKRDQIENYESENDAFVVEDYRGAALVENIELI